MLREQLESDTTHLREYLYVLETATEDGLEGPGSSVPRSESIIWFFSFAVRVITHQALISDELTAAVSRSIRFIDNYSAKYLVTILDSAWPSSTGKPVAAR
jgi:hypothetical protein